VADVLDQELQDTLKDIVASCELEDDEIRRRMCRQWQKYEEFWHGAQHLFWSEADDAWCSPVDLDATDSDLKDELSGFRDKVVNVFRGHGEAIIAALAGQIPALRYLPDDADEESDILAARTRGKVADLVQRHNKAKLVFLRALFFLALQGIVASYRYVETDPKYGTFPRPVMGEQETPMPVWKCADCGETSTEPIETCPACGSSNVQETQDTQKVPVITETKILPKSRVKIDTFGPLHFKVSFYARNQKECSYLLLFGDVGKDLTMDAYPELADAIDAETSDAWNRVNRAEYTINLGRDAQSKQLITIRKCWLRPAAYNRCNDKTKREKLKKKFPTGVKVTLLGANKIFADAVEEDLDEKWEIGQAGLSTFIYSDPILKPLVQVQEMRNDLVNLILQTIKHGIPFMLADPKVLNFDQYGKFQAVPGTVSQTKAATPGQAIGASFWESARATLSREVAVFLNQLDEDAQFTVGSFPSIYGGPSEGKSRTFSEYAASRQMALQRLSIVWNLITDWWVRTIAGAVDMYVAQLERDEHYTVYDTGTYIKVWIKQAELTGKIGGVEPDASETFPVTLAQKRDLLMKLIELNNDYINTALYTPENSRILQDVLALGEFKLPGESQRVKQAYEVNLLLKEAPIDPQTATIPIDVDIDDHKVHIGAIVAWAVDVVGIDTQRENPEGYANVIAHMRMHLAALVQQTMQTNQTPAGAPPVSNEPQNPQVKGPQ
jgi:hypothetical protein